MKKEEILSRCIDEVRSRRSTIEDCLARYPQFADDLRPLLEIAAGLHPEETVPTAEFRQRARSHLLKVMGPAPSMLPRRAVRWHPGSLLPARALNVALSLVVALWMVAVAGGTVYASQGSLPGEALYPVKTGVEKLHLAVTLKQEDRADLRLKLAERRVDEVAIQSSLKQEVSPAALSEVADQLDMAVSEMAQASPQVAKDFASRLAAATLQQQITLDKMMEAAPASAQAPLQQVMDVARRGNVIAQVAYENPGFLKSRPSVRDKDIEEGRFTIAGTVDSIDGRTWSVGGVTLGNVNSSNTTLTPGTAVKLQGLTRQNQVYVISVERDEAPEDDVKPEDEVKIQGVFGGASAGGTTWYIGGVPVGVQSDKTPPNQGEKLEVSGPVKNGTLSSPQVQSGEMGGEKQRVEVEGVLSAVNTGLNTITVNTAGTTVTISLSGATVVLADGKRLNITDLGALVGKGIHASGIYRKDSTIYAKEIRVDARSQRQSAKGEARGTGNSGQDGSTKPDSTKTPEAGSDRQRDTSRDSEGSDRQRDTSKDNEGSSRDTQRSQTVGLSGVVSSVTDSSLVVGGKRVSINKDTKIEGKLAAGVTIEGTARVNPDGSLVALQVQVKSQSARSRD